MKQSNNLNNNDFQHDHSAALNFLRKSVMMRAALVVVVILLSIALVFSLTVAWYTNVVQSGGLTFSAEKWDFDGSVTVGNVGEIYPGSNGIVPLKIKNNGDVLAAASITVSKEQMDLEMKQRIYFYVDTNLVRNGEMIDKVYVSMNYSYTYTLFPKNEIIINDDVQNAPPIKWEWTYDVLGYYVVATNPVGSTDDLEYIRPIVYDYDETKTTFTETGILETLDGITTPEKFLADESLKDGFPGILSADKITSNNGNFYPISVDENGHGIWAYFCTFAEISQNTEYDTNIGQNGLVNCAAKVFITGQNVSANPVSVGTESGLKQAIELANGNLIQLSGDITLSETLDITNGVRAMIDLNGYSIKSSASNIFYANEGSSLMIQNGTVEGADSSATSAVYSSGANVTLNNVTISNVEEGIMLRDNTSAVNSRLYIASSKIVAEEDGLWIYGNQDEESGKTSVIIEDTVIEGKNYSGILFNGTYWGTDVYISGSTITGYYTSIYHPQKDSTLNIYNSTLSGITGIVIKGGTVNIVDSVITGTAPTSQPPAENVSGWSDTGDGVYLEGNYEWSAIVNISGENTRITKTAADASAVRNADFGKGYSTIIITGGQFDTNVYEYCDMDEYSITENEGMFIVKLK